MAFEGREVQGLSSLISQTLASYFQGIVLGLGVAKASSAQWWYNLATAAMAGLWTR